MSSTSSSASSLDFVGDLQNALKRQRAIGGMQTNLLPRRVVAPHSRTSRPVEVETKPEDSVSSLRSVLNEEEGACKLSSSVTVAQDGRAVQPERSNVTASELNDGGVHSEPGVLTGASQCRPPDAKRKVQFSNFQEIEWDRSSQVDTLPCVADNESKSRNVRSVGLGGGVEPPRHSSNAFQEELHDLRHFLVRPITQTSVSSTSCATTTLIHSSSAPMLNSTTHCSSVVGAESGKGVQKFPEEKEQLGMKLGTRGERTNSEIKSPKFTIGAEEKESHLSVEHSSDPKSNVSNICVTNKTTKEAVGGDNVEHIHSSAALPQIPPSDSKPESIVPDRQTKVATGKASTSSRKRSYDPDLFFKVNGKLYQRLGKIGSGGSSEVHKVISSDCTIYALKKIKLKGRDYATAYGFCQEIEYLSRLRGKKNIIQLIDYEVTDKAFLREVLNCRMDNKDAKVKDDGFIYMVLEYGEIDLAHMLSQKWKEMEGFNQSLDENWLRFYWQQILDAVNTIHEERIVHSDLKPANFLLVKGLLKLIDFGIAKAIMNDTTNIQRDSQMGTLSYMSPEAFLCNERDENGNIIKCGRSSDIWSLGCILYQMVYGRTPFSDYKTFWAKFKVITDPNHVISYGPVSNPWLLDIMQRCLAWDRKNRWRIPQLLEHPFLVPPVPDRPGLSDTETCELLGLLAKTCHKNREVSEVCNQLQECFRKPSSENSDPESHSHRKMLLLLKLRISLANADVE